MTNAQMLDRFLACDASCDGRFFIGVLTTGIYCLPSCTARKPKPENIRFFPTCAAARESGLRPCRRCHPDDFERGADPVLETIEILVSEIRAAPQNFPDIRAIVRRSGFGTTRLFELFRRHYHATPAGILLRARFDAARRALLSTAAPLLRIAGRAGFESQSAFHEHFRRFTGMTPAAYRKLADPAARTFEIALPKNYSFAHMLRTFGRDPHSLTERMHGDTYTAALRLNGAPALLTLRFTSSANNNVAQTTLSVPSVPPASAQPTHPPILTHAPAPATPAHPTLAAQAHAIAAALLGLAQDVPAFVRHARRLGLARLVAGREGLRLAQTHSVFDALCWSIVGQQITLAFAFTLRRRLVERAGTPIAGAGLHAPPTPQAIAALDPADLLAIQFSRQKADYLISAARLIAGGQLDIENLSTLSATRAERTLFALRGLGPWSVNYIMMRALGFADCVPYGDTGLTNGLKTLFNLATRPDAVATRRLMLPFSPHRTLATAHLWQLIQPQPRPQPPAPGSRKPRPAATNLRKG
jgi:AraC family transcriptional regulator of adaptative response / DNA-3-methyladenine glycosylase II